MRVTSKAHSTRDRRQLPAGPRSATGFSRWRARLANVLTTEAFRRLGSLKRDEKPAKAGCVETRSRPTRATSSKLVANQRRLKAGVGARAKAPHPCSIRVSSVASPFSSPPSKWERFFARKVIRGLTSPARLILPERPRSPFFRVFPCSSVANPSSSPPSKLVRFLAREVIRGLTSPARLTRARSPLFRALPCSSVATLPNPKQRIRPIKRLTCDLSRRYIAGACSLPQ
jgi:hypothetical protein